MYYVYVNRCLRDGRLYVGRTDDLKRRYKEHQEGKVWTTKRMLPIKLIFYEAFYSKKDTIRREKYLKTSKGKSSLKMIVRDSMK
ncbi:MAG: GIY-YIG nuclease family protein [Candidatus Komeilibacteria bacterium]|nr:GIY-YIG nuclease family protein [Candidatus Komeilibacteria bacterium]